MDKEARAYVLDATALFVGATESARGRLFTTHSVIAEVRGDPLQVARAEALIESGAVNVGSPSRRSVEHVESAARRMGEVKRLSSTDKEILALAMELSESFREVFIVTDDYAVQSLAEALGLKWVGLKYQGIRRGT